MARVVTLGEVARAAGVSLATASRALNGSSRRVNADLAERVLATAAELGYVPNVNAQAVARGSSNVLGLILHDIADPYFGAIASGVTSTAERHGLMVMLCSTNRQPDREFAYVGMLHAQRVRALILAGSRTTDKRRTEELGRELAAYAAGGGRVAAISQPRLPVDTVAAENRAGSKDLAIALAAQGHREFAVLTGPRTLITANDRLAGFRAGLASAGLDLDDDHVITAAFTRDGGYAAATETARPGPERHLRVRGDRHHGRRGDGRLPRRGCRGPGPDLRCRLRRHRHPPRPVALAHHRAPAVGAHGRAGVRAGPDRQRR